jgi:preprotein translocase SecF subunit
MTMIVFVYRGGPNYGIDFTGGILMQISFQEENVALQDVRRAIENSGISSFELQSSENLITIRTKQIFDSQEEFKNLVKDAISTKVPNNNMEIKKIEYVGSTVGAYFFKRAFYAFLFAFIGMIIYIGFRFKSVLWGFSAVVGIVHDIIISFGFVLLVNKEVNITVVAALLTIAGYSINDTIVLFDRIKENLEFYSKKDFGVVINNSTNDVLVRTVVTSLTVFIVSCSLFFFGGEVIHTFAYVMIIGTCLGVFSSIFICAPLVYELETRRRKYLKTAIK